MTKPTVLTLVGENTNQRLKGIAVYPNPFDQLTSISYNITADAAVTVVLYDQSGKEIKRLVDNEMQNTGSYQLTFDGTSLPVGSYICQ
ncbi:MAG: T9SS type A sorting domain-containing protein, partial [Saprospiraceae bacterium]